MKVTECVMNNPVSILNISWPENCSLEDAYPYDPYMIATNGKSQAKLNVGLNKNIERFIHKLPSTTPSTYLKCLN